MSGPQPPEISSILTDVGLTYHQPIASLMEDRMTQTLSAKDRIFCAIDTTDLDHAIDLASNLSGVIGGAKLGKEFFAAHGPQGVRAVAKAGMPIFLDVKYHDIPNTVAGAVRGLKGPIEDRVVKLAELTQKAGLDGVVCSAREITPVRKALGPDFKLITPGIRPVWATSDDQKRVVSPADAVAMGSDVLVIGRPITKADDPVAAAQKIVAELS